MAFILMIDDNPQSQRYIERIVRLRTPHQIVFAGSSSAAIDRLVERRPDLILLDLFIPGDGFELFETLRQHPATESIPIVIHTAVPLDPLTQLRLSKMRYEGFVEFPIEASELNRIIDKALERNSGPARRWVPPRA